jgi:hypothetical protein
MDKEHNMNKQIIAVYVKVFGEVYVTARGTTVFSKLAKQFNSEAEATAYADRKGITAYRVIGAY